MKLETLISSEELQARIAELGAEIKKDYEGKELIVVCVLTGSVFFTVDLSKHLDQQNTIFDFMQVKSYKGTESTGIITLTKELTYDIKDKHVMVIEDIVDTGLTLEYIINYLKAKEPKSLKLCALLHKNKVDIKADYTGFNIENKFVIGYGLDYDEKYRNLDYIGVNVGE